MQCAPIVLFAYNRPDHLQLTVEALQKNELASQSELFIYSDAAKTENDIEPVLKVREYAKSVSGFLTVNIIERKENWGLADSIIDGVSFLTEKYGTVIVLEDDILTSPFFLKYMNKALQMYIDSDNVMHIAAYMPPVNASHLPESFFLRQASCWGWATWKRSWKYFSRDSKSLIEQFNKSNIHEFNMEGGYNYWSQVLQNHRGEKKTWAVFWYANVFLANGLCLHPRESLVSNIGFDGSGQNCVSSSHMTNNFTISPINNFPSKEHMAVHKEGYKVFRNYFDRNQKPSISKRLLNKISRFFGSQQC